ncbi:MAG: UDP-N-acetylmuramate dehydrogenase [Thermoguttaceae bacterium]
MTFFGATRNMAQFDQFLTFVRRDVPLAMHTQLQVGGPAEFFAEPESYEQLIDLLQQCRKENVPVRLLGAGSNVLAREEGVSGVVLSLSHPMFTTIQVLDDQIEAGAGATLGHVITKAVINGLAGLEDFIGIPGTVGGALCCNVGTSSGAIGQCVESVTIVGEDGLPQTLQRHEISFGYRTSSLDGMVILSAKFRLTHEDANILSKRMQKLWIVRKMQQPTGQQTVAYVFGNPRTGTSASELIERAGLKGTRIGGAALADQDARFVTIDPVGTVEDVMRLIRFIQEEVSRCKEVALEPVLDIW